MQAFNVAVCTAVWASGACLAQEDACNQVGTAGAQQEAIALRDIGELKPDLMGQQIVVEGTFRGRFQDKRLCTDASAEASCIRLDHRSLHQPGLETILIQWNGERLRLTGKLVPWGPPGGFILEAHHLEVLSRPPSPAFCPGYEGPLEASPAEDDYDERWSLGRVGRQRFPDGSEIALHVYKAEAGFFPAGWVDRPAEIIEFAVPPPYSGRDIRTFAAFSKHKYAFTLREGGLYVWEPGTVRLVERPEPGGRIGNVWRGNDSCIYYYVAKQAGGTFWNGIKRLGANLETSLIWGSSTERVESTQVWYEGAFVLRTIDPEHGGGSRHVVPRCTDDSPEQSPGPS